MSEMNRFRRQIMQRLLPVHLRDGHFITIVECSDGTYGIEFDGNLTPLIWPTEEKETCVDVFEYFVLAHGGARVPENRN